MTSIRFKLTLGSALIFAGGIGLLLAANLFFLEPYYAARTKGDFIKILSTMKEGTDDLPALTLRAKSLAAGSGFKIVVADRGGTALLSSVPEFRDGQRFPLPRDQFEFFTERRARLEGGEVFFGILNAAPPGQAVVQLMAAMGGGRFLVIAQPLEHFRRSIAVASRFFLIVGTIVLVLEFAVVLVLSGRMARPILDLSQLAHRIAASDFAARYRHRRDDEIGVLGDSLNAMAASLERNMADLSAANRRLALKVETQADFVAGASHELKTPVGLVRGYAEALKLGMYDSEAERDELADVILDEADHLDRLVRDLADIATLGGEGRSLLLNDGDLFETVSKAVSRFAIQAKAKRVGLGLEGKGPMPARFDADRMLQLMDNLLSNAIRHASEGGAVTVRLETTGEQFRIEVENEGEGVGDEHLPRLFEPFYRADPSHSRRSGGSGLGLAVVKGVAEAHGGSCGLRNTATGFLVWATLPLVPSPKGSSV